MNVKRNDGFERLFTRSPNHERLTPPAADPTLRCRPGLTYQNYEKKFLFGNQIFVNYWGCLSEPLCH